MPQSFAQILIHVVFSTKYREPLIQHPIRRELHRYLTGILNNQGWTPLQVGGIEDHVHILFNLPRTMTVADVVEELKTSSTKWIKTKGKQYEKFRWQSGYAAFSVNKFRVDHLIRYIQNQEQHHKKMAFQNEFLVLLKRHGVQYDERHIWD